MMADQAKKYLALLSAVIVWMAPLSALGRWSDLEPSQMKEIIRVAKTISVVQPNLPESKYIEYALGIYRASHKYRVEPEVLIAITQHETNFREDLPEGKAGELGICQIRKMWIKNRKFRKEFRKARVRDLFTPSKSFMFAAWILKDLKINENRTTLPYWSFYNAVHFEPRFKYFLAVNKNLVAIRRFDLFSQPDLRLEQVAQVEAPDTRASQTTPYPALKVNYLPPSAPASPKQAPQRTVAQEVAEARQSETVPQRAARWISDALAKLQQQSRTNQNEEISPDLVRTAEQLGLGSFYTQAAIED